MLRTIGYFFIVIILSSPSVSQSAGRQAWILVDTHTLILTVFSADNHAIVRFHNIAIGSGSAAETHFRGDDTTPLGSFHVAWINRHSRFGTFFGLDYPTLSPARLAYAEGRITATQSNAIIDAFRQHRIPPQNTPLGGQLGIHGMGSGNPRIQQSVNWTDGCVAVTNRETRMLDRWMHIGTEVVIR